ncbi:potassium/sodium hyperpolarization-activated cyclic nucleotide-gated channel 4-like [Penaeus monodon]|uniref:potassium/sodium hyperpolarization-activated cyclic nucleotide-gated channel 4-like n=1 Tax=Penaeus monodon TaxID=6687 RepID=UPI0018A6DFB9|nr:potassium/sodium hyperpolarization-activated cyclic nucleotide-gated channel 4-like [Penaeus monodon]
MAYPARLEVATLLGAGEGGSEDPPGAPTANPGLPPVADTTTTAPQGVFVIADSAKRSKSAGMVASGRAASSGRADPLRPPAAAAPVGRLAPSPRPRSSPRIGRRCTRVTPLPPGTVLHAPPDATDGLQEPSRRAKGKATSPAGRRPSRPTPGRSPSHPPWSGRSSRASSAAIREDAQAPWPTSSLDSGPIEHSTPAPSSSPARASSKESRSPWRGMYTVPTINVASDTSSTGRKWLRYCASPSSDVSNFTSLEHSRYVTERIHNLVTAFSQRASRVKAQITQPPTPSTELSEGGEDSHRPPDLRQRLDSLMPELSSRSPSPHSLVGVNTRRARLLRRFRSCRRALDFPKAMEPHSRLYIWWLLVVSIAYVYNAWVIPLRFVFSEYQNEQNLVYWMGADYTADLIYVMDILLFQSRIKYLANGFWVSSSKLMRTHYVKSAKFRYDLIALLPLDFLYFKFGHLSIFRLPRLIKIKTFWEFFNRLDSVLSSPHAVRVVRTVLNMLYLIHLNTCAYYGFSKVEGIGSNRWVFQGKGNAVFVFALLIGQIRDIVATATRNQNEYRKVMDQTQAYLHRLNLPPLLQERVRLWFTYTWHNQKTLDEMRCLQSLPRKMRTDIAINVHIQTLSKVQLFQDCDKALLRDLVLKLKPVLYLPGDYVCKKGEVGKEMYIVQTGQVLVMGGERGDVVLATLGEGSVFGEISLLALAGGNRRTANVRSRGFSSLFVLSKSDLQATIKDYPEAQEILKKKAKRLIKQNQAREKQEPPADENVIIKSRESTPKLLHTVLQVVRPDSYTASVIRRSSRTFSRSTLDIPSFDSVSEVGGWPWLPSPRQLVSSASLEVPTRSSRRSARMAFRSSLEVPSNSIRHLGGGVPAKTSMSESLAEEEEEVSLVPSYGFERVCSLLKSGASVGHCNAALLSDGRGSPPCAASTVGAHSRPDSRRSSFPQSSRAARYSPVSLTRQAALTSLDYSSPPSVASDAITYVLLQEEPQSPDTPAPSGDACAQEPPSSAPRRGRGHPPAPSPARSPPAAEETHSPPPPPPPAPPAETGSARSPPCRPSHQGKGRKTTPNGSRGSSGRGPSARNKVGPAEGADGNPRSALMAAEAKREPRADRRDDLEAKAKRASGNSVRNGRVVGERAKKTSSSSSSTSSTSSSSAARDAENNKASSARPFRGAKGGRASAGEKAAPKTGKGGEAASKGGKAHAARASRHGGRGTKGRQTDSRGRSKGQDLGLAAEHQSADSAIQLSALDASDRSNGSDGAGQQRQTSLLCGHSQSNGVHQREMAAGSSSSLQTALAEDARRPAIVTESLQAGNSLGDAHRTQHHFRHGLSSSVESGIILDTPSSALCHVGSKESYDIFLTELSKTLPLAPSQGGESRTPKGRRSTERVGFLFAQHFGFAPKPLLQDLLFGHCPPGRNAVS